MLSQQKSTGRLELESIMDLLESILGSMDKPPSMSEREKERAKGEFVSLHKFLPGSLAVQPYKF